MVTLFVHTNIPTRMADATNLNSQSYASETILPSRTHARSAVYRRTDRRTDRVILV